MVAIVTGKGLGLEPTSGFVLGSRGTLGDATFGRLGENITVNAATGNLIINRTDEILVGRGPDSVISRAYNSLGGIDADQWQFGMQRQITAITGTKNVTGSTATRVDWDGSQIVYTYSAGAYRTTEGAGAYDTMTYNAGTDVWTWTDGDTQEKETYSGTYGYKIGTRVNTDGISATYTYSGTGLTAKLSRVSTFSGEYTDLTWVGNNVTEMVSALSGGTSVIRMRYAYDGQDRLVTVTTDLATSDNSVADGRTVVTNYSYDGTSNRVASITQTGGARIDISYTLVGSDYRVASVAETMSLGVTNTTSFSYNTSTRVTTVTDVKGVTTKLTYDVNGQLERIEHPSTSQNVYFSYEGDGDVSSYTDAGGKVTNYTYDANGNLEFERNAAGITVERKYGAKNELLNVVRYLVADPDGAGAGLPSQPLTTRFAYSSTNNLRFAISAEGEVTEYIYNAYGLQTSSITYRDNIYDVSALATTATLSEATMASWVSGIANRSTVARTDTTYDFRGNIATVTSYSKASNAGVGSLSDPYTTITYIYDQSGNLLSRQANDGSLAETFAYDGLGRAIRVTNKAGSSTWTSYVDAQNKTIVSLANGLIQTSVYNAAGHLVSFVESRVDHSGNNVQPDLAQWSYTGVTRASAGTVDGATAYKYTASTTGVGAAAYLDFAGQAGEVATFAVSLQAVAGSATSQLIGLYGNASGWGPGNISSARIVSGPGTLSSNGTGHWTVSGLSTTEPTRIEVTRLLTQTESVGAYVYVDNLGGFRAGQSIIVSAPSIITSKYDPAVGGGSFNMAPLDINSWGYGGATRTAAGTIDGYATASQFTVQTSGVWTGIYAGFTAAAGDTFTGTVSLKGTGTSTSASFGIYSDSVGWSSRPDYNATVRIISGPGTLVDQGGGIWAITGLSTTISTRVEVVRTFAAAGTGGFYIYPDYATAGNALIVGAPSIVRTSGASTSNHYDSLGRLRMVRDSSGGVTYYTYDAVGRLTAEIAADGAVTEYGYDAANRLVKTRSFANKLNSTQLASLVDVNGYPVDVSPRPVVNDAADRWEWRIYDSADRLLEVIDHTGAATIFAYDGTSNLISTTSYYNKISSVSGFRTTTPTTVQTPTVDASKDNVSRHFYDKSGRLIGSLDGAGYLTQTIYNKGGEVIETIAFATAVAAPPSTLRASGTFAQLLTNVGTTTRDLRVRNFYDGRGLLRYTLDAALRPTEYVYSAAGDLLHKNEYGASIASTSTYTLAYIEGQISSLGLVSHAGTRQSWTVYNAGRLTYAIDAVGAVTRFTYDSVGQVVKTTRFADKRPTTSDPSFATMESWASGVAANASNRTERFVYDLSGQLVYGVDAEGYVTEYRYDDAGRKTLEIRYPAAYTVADGATQASMYALIGGTIPGTAVQTSFTYDALGRLADSYDGEGVRTHFEYDAFDRVTDRTLAYGTADATTTRYTYDLAGRVLTETRGYGATEASTTGYTYDGMGRVLTETRAQGTGDAVTITYTYDAIGNLTSVKRPIDGSYDAETKYGYDAFGNVLTTTDPRNNVSYSFYDNLNRLTLQLDAEGFVTETGYNAMSEVTSVKRYAARYSGSVSAPTINATVGEDATTSFTRDKLGRITGTTDAMGASEAYILDAFGDRVRVTNKLGGATDYGYDRRGLLRYEYVDGTSTLANGTVQGPGYYKHVYNYDSRGNLFEQVDAYALIEERRIYYTYDKLDRLTETKSMAVDVASTSSVGPSGTGAQFTKVKYDRLGNVIETSDATGARTLFYYDDLGNKIREINALGTMSEWTYDKNGNALTARVYGDVVTLPGIAGGTPPAPVNASNYRQTSFTYDKLNRLVTTTIAGLRTGTYNGSTYAVTAAGGANITTTNYYDKNGNIVQQTDGRGSNIYTFYDKLGRRVGQVDQESYLTVWALDADGNVSQEKRSATKVAITPVADRPGQTATTIAALQTSAGTSANDRTTNFTYDRNGRRLTEERTGVTAWTINATTGALTAASTTAVVTYAYNGLGEVTRKTESTGDYIDYVYDTQGRQTSMTSSSFLDHTTASVQRTTTNTYNGLDQLTRTVQNGTRLTKYTYDLAGQLSTMTDPAGTTRTYYYDAAGRLAHDIYTRFTSSGISTGTGTGITEANTTTYDALGRVLSQGMAVNTSAGVWTFSGDRTKLAYNVYGEVTGQGINDKMPEVSEYDAGGRVWKTTAGDGTVKLFLYDGNGNQTLTISSNGAALPGGYSWATITVDQAITLLTNSGATTIGNHNVAGMVVTITVYDKRGQALETREPLRETTVIGSSLSTISHKRNYNAFGEVAQETDARNNTTDFSYNTMGRLVEKKSPQVSVTGETGVVLTGQRPTETYYYDLSGRLVGVQDANGNLNKRALLSGTGYEGSEALVTAVFGADNYTSRIFYDVFNDARILRDGNSQDETRSYDVLGNLTKVVRRGGLLTEEYRYDALGQRIMRWNDQFGISVVERTDYDAQGRVISTIDMAGYQTTYSYVWSGAVATTGLGTFGGWVKTTSTVADRASPSDGIYAAVEKVDYFGRMVERSDKGGHVSTSTFDIAGRTTQQARFDGSTIQYGYYNTGQLAKIVEGKTPAVNSLWTQDTTDYTYDVDGHMLSEKRMARWSDYRPEQYNDDDPMNPIVIPAFYMEYNDLVQDGRTTYDAMGRMATYQDYDILGTLNASLSWEYDAASNIRRMRADFREMQANGTLAPGLTGSPQDYYYKYDAMNRFVVTKGTLVGSAIVLGTEGRQLTYDAAGRRATMTNASGITETYAYTANGELSTVSATVSGSTTTRASYTRDALGRVTTYNEYNAAGTNVHSRYAIVYDAIGQTLAEKTKTLQGSDWIYAHTVNQYSATGTGSASAAITGSGNTGTATGQTLYYSETKFWQNGATTPVYSSSADFAYADSYSSYTYDWYDGAVQTRADLTNRDGFSYALYENDTNGRLNVVGINGGSRPRSIRFRLDANGQVLRRGEADWNFSTNDPQQRNYIFNGLQMGTTGNNGTSNTDYVTAIAARTASPGSGPFRGGATTATIASDFDQSFDFVTAAGQGDGPTSYTVATGDTLSGIAQAVWGDASLWYMIADANGLSSDDSLAAGMSLIIPAKIGNFHNNASTFRPYNPNEAIGDIGPNTPKPPKKGCGAFGQILTALIAIAVTAFLPTVAPIFSSFWGGIGAAVAGSVVSQGFGIATGIQDKFSFKGVALAALSAGVSGGLSELGAFGKLGVAGTGWAARAAQGVLSGAISQGVGVATGLQKKFDWAGIAAGGIGGAIGGLVGGKIGGTGGRVAGGAADLLASAASRSLITGTSFGDNVVAVLPSVIGRTVGAMIEDANARRSIVVNQQALNASGNRVFGASGAEAGGNSPTIQGNIATVALANSAAQQTIAAADFKKNATRTQNGSESYDAIDDNRFDVGREGEDIVVAATREQVFMETYNKSLEWVNPWNGFKKFGVNMGGVAIEGVKGIGDGFVGLYHMASFINDSMNPGLPGAYARNMARLNAASQLKPIDFVAPLVNATDQALTYDNFGPVARLGGASIPPGAAGFVAGKLITRLSVAETIGPRIVSPRGFVELDEFSRLNVLDPAVGKLRPGEASAAVELQQVLGGRLERLAEQSGADFKFVSGPQAGKSVDFLLTPGTIKEAAGINQFFIKNADRFSAQLTDHLGKADIVPIDSRFLTPENQNALMSIVGKQSAVNQSRIVIFR